LKKLLTTLALVVLMAAGAGTAFAEVVLDAAGWQAGKAEKPARPAVWSDATETALDAKKAPLLRGKAVLKNRGPVAAEGVLVRYAVAARLSPAESKGQGDWALTFLLDERRVPKIGPNAVLEVPLSLSPKLDLYLSKLKTHGFRPSELKLQVMVAPHPESPIKVLDAVLAVKP
jgi:hypothetical protein